MILYEIIVTFLVVNLVITESRFRSSLTIKKLNKNIGSDQEDYRLPDSIKPENYKIVLTPHFSDEFDEKFTFNGFVEITFDIQKEVSAVIVHSKNLEFNRDDVFLRRKDNNQSIVATIEYDPEKNFKYITPKIFANMTSGKYILSIKYKGILNKDKEGFHIDSYTNQNDEEILFAKTQFEPVFARQAFPCFDEPALKATFDLTIRHPFNYSAISNMPIKTSISIGALQETTFQTTPVMSTYLLAFLISDFKNIYKNENFTVYTRPDRVNDGKLALEAGQKILEVLESYTGVPFALPKIDQVADPGRGGAMENWGLILYQEIILLGDVGEEEVIKIIAHEFAHQWFGNLVTPKWWKYVWLSEGFSTFFQNYIIDQIKPQWRSTFLSVIQDRQEALFVDSMSSYSEPLNKEVGSPTEIKEIFKNPVIAYKKGSAIVRMMYHFLGEDIFKRGLNIYLTKNKYKAVDSSDLFIAFKEAMKEHKFDLGSDLENIMNSWVTCKGFPVVTVTRDYNNPGLIIIEQKRFEAFSFLEENEDNQEYCNWHVPINYATARNPEFYNTSVEFWLQESLKNVSIKIESDEWIIINKQQTGFYRVNYDDKNWQLIINQLNSQKFDKIHVLNRAQILNDALDFAKKNGLQIKILLDLISYLEKEMDYIAFKPGNELIAFLVFRLRYTDHFLSVKEKVVNMARAIFKSIDLESSTESNKPVDERIKEIAIYWACYFKDTTCPDEPKNDDFFNDI